MLPLDNLPPGGRDKFSTAGVMGIQPCQLPGEVPVTSSLSTYRGLSAELCPDVDEVLLEESLLASDLFQVLWLILVLLCLPV